MIKTKKICYSCKELSYIWKNIEGRKYCKKCSARENFQQSSFKTINKVSNKKKIQDIEYSKLRKEFLNKPENFSCRAKLEGCLNHFGENLTIHHTKGRGKYYLEVSTWIPLCLKCHAWVENNPKEARLLGFSDTKLI